MVQKKMAKTCNTKLGNNTLKAEKKQAIIKPSLQNHDGKSKVADLKAIKMKKSRSIKRCNVVEMGLQSSQPAHTPSPKKALQCKSPYTSPNYMKSTTSSEARKEKLSKLGDISSTSNLHRVATKTLNKTCSSMKKIRCLTKAPCFKHTRSGSCKKMVLCKTDLAVQKATCSSTLKDSKFPNYLELKPGATEAEGNSVFKVCPYRYCSLNGHHHISAPPLKRFLSSRRRLLKTLKVRPDVLSPCKVKPSKCGKANGGGEHVEDFFVKVYAPDGEVASQVSESLLDGPCSETEFEDDLEQIEVTHLSDMDFSPEDGEYSPTLIQKQSSFESLTDSLDEYFGVNSDIEWEEGQSPATNDKFEMYVQTDYSKDQDKIGCELYSSASKYLECSDVDQDDAGFELNNSVCEYVEFRAEGYTAYIHDEIVECQHFSDTESLPESASTHAGDKNVKDVLMVADDMEFESYSEITEYTYLADEVTVCAAKLEDESMDKYGKLFSDTVEGITEARKDENYSAEESKETKDAAELVLEESEPIERAIKHAPSITDSSETCNSNEKVCMANKDVVAETEHSGSGNGDEYRVSRTESSGEEILDKVPLPSDEYNDVEVKKSAAKDHKRGELGSNNGESSSDLELFGSCSKLKRVSRCRKAEKDIGEDREFNPRGPNFLAIEPEPEAEKVDLRHQEMDERRNAEEWMLDHALQKTVNQLAPARKRKVALLVEAFESVLPMPKCESHRSRTSGFPYARTI